MAYLPDTRLLVTSELAGEARVPHLLKATLGSNGAAAAAAARAAGRGAERRACTRSPALRQTWRRRPVHRPADEVASLRRDLAAVEEVWPDVAARVARALDPPSRAVPNVRRLVLSHGDFTPSQVLGLDGHAPAVLDLDTLCWADPAEDLGRYLAHVALLAAKGGDPSPGDTLERLAEELVGGYVEAAARPTAGAGPRPHRLLHEHDARAVGAQLLPAAQDPTPRARPVPAGEHLREGLTRDHYLRPDDDRHARSPPSGSCRTGWPRGWTHAGSRPGSSGDVPELRDGRHPAAGVHARPAAREGRRVAGAVHPHASRSRGGAPREIVLVGNLWPPGRQPSPAGRPRRRRLRGAGVAVRHRRPEPGPAGADRRRRTPGPAAAGRPRRRRPGCSSRCLEGAGYGDVTITSCDPVVVRYKPGSRCTVVVGLGYDGRPAGRVPPDRVVLKTHQGEKGESAWEAMNVLWQHPGAWAHAVRLAEPLGYLPDERILVQGPVPEDCTLKDLARQAIAERDPDLLERAAGEPCPRPLVRSPRCTAPVRRTGGPPRSRRSWTRSARSSTASRAVCPPWPRRPGRCCRRLTELARETAPDPAVSSHHDFRPAQVLLHGEGVGFIDFDGACMAEPALDLGRFRAKLRDIGISALGLDGTRHPRRRGRGEPQARRRSLRGVPGGLPGALRGLA